MRPARERAEALEDGVLGLGVERGGRLVEDEDVGLLAHEGARERDLLPLAAGELDAVLEPAAELRVEPFGQTRRRAPSAPPLLDGALDARRRPPGARRCRGRRSRASVSWYWLKSWKTTPMRRRRASSSHARRSRPSSRMRPSVGS